MVTDMVAMVMEVTVMVMEKKRKSPFLIGLKDSLK